MILRIATVIKVLPEEGKVVVTFEDSGNSSVPLPMMTFGEEYSMPKVGDTVATMHMQNGSSKGVCLGTFYGGDKEPNMPQGQRRGYRKDFENDPDNDYYSHLQSKDGVITIKAKNIVFQTDYGTISIQDIIG